MVGPLSFGIQFMPKEGTFQKSNLSYPLVSIWFVDTPNVLSLVTTLLITFYWQEILSVISERLQNTLINRLCKHKIKNDILILRISEIPMAVFPYFACCYIYAYFFDDK